MPKHDAGQQYTDKQLIELKKRISTIYSDAQKDMQAKLDEFTAKHEVKNRIHLQELADGKITQADYDSWMRGQVFQGKQWMAKRDQLADVLYDANKEAVNILNGGTISVLAKNANFMAYTLEHGAGVNFGFGLYDATTVTNLLKNDPNILPFKKLDKAKDKRWNFQKIRNQITQGIIQGERLDQIAKRLAEVTSSTNENLMMTHARTAMTSAQNAGRQIRLEDAKKLGIKLKKEWMATLDLHTRDAHRDLDGQKVDVDKPFKVDGYEIRFPADPHAQPYLVYNCRCTLVADIDDYPEEYQRYDNIDGEPIKNMTYREWEQWKKQQLKSTAIKGIREFPNIKFNVAVSGYQKIVGGYSIQDGGEIYGTAVHKVTINKRNTTEWDKLPIETRKQLYYTVEGDKPWNLSKGTYHVTRYVEGAAENIERDEIAKALDAEYLGFTLARKGRRYYYVDFYKKDNDLLYSVGKADLIKTLDKESIKVLHQTAIERDKEIIKMIGDNNFKNITARNGDDWVTAMKEYHRAIDADGLPTILPKKEYDKINTPVLYRGIAPQSALRSDITTDISTKEMADEFFKGLSPFPSRGIYGDGIAYASPELYDIAVNYATNSGRNRSGGVIIEFKLKEDARTITYEDALELFHEVSKDKETKLLFQKAQHNAYDKEVGKAMNALGYDAIIKHNGDNTGYDFYVILNRGALVTKENYITKMIK